MTGQAWFPAVHPEPRSGLGHAEGSVNICRMNKRAGKSGHFQTQLLLRRYQGHQTSFRAMSHSTQAPLFLPVYVLGFSCKI